MVRFQVQSLQSVCRVPKIALFVSFTEWINSIIATPIITSMHSLANKNKMDFVFEGERVNERVYEGSQNQNMRNMDAVVGITRNRSTGRGHRG